MGARIRLQLLTEGQAALVRLFGQQSGRLIFKLVRLEKSSLVEYKDAWPYLKDAAGYLDLTVTSFIKTGLDHDLALGVVTSHTNLSPAPTLTTLHLKEHRIIR